MVQSKSLTGRVFCIPRFGNLLQLHLLSNIKYKLLFFSFRMFHNLVLLIIYHAVTEALCPLLISTGPILSYFKMYFLKNEIKLF